MNEKKKWGAINALALRQQIESYLYIFESLPSLEDTLSGCIQRLRALAEDAGDISWDTSRDVVDQGPKTMAEVEEEKKERTKRLDLLVKEAKACVNWSELGVAGKTALFNQLQRSERYLKLKPEIDPCLTEVFFKP